MTNLMPGLLICLSMNGLTAQAQDREAADSTGLPGDNFSLPYDLLSARLQLTYEPAQLSIFVNGNNLTKEVYRTFAFGSPVPTMGQVGALNDPRTITFGVRKTF